MLAVEKSRHDEKKLGAKVRREADQKSKCDAARPTLRLLNPLKPKPTVAKAKKANKAVAVASNPDANATAHHHLQPTIPADNSNQVQGPIPVVLNPVVGTGNNQIQAPTPLVAATVASNNPSW